MITHCARDWVFTIGGQLLDEFADGDFFTIDFPGEVSKRTGPSGITVVSCAVDTSADVQVTLEEVSRQNQIMAELFAAQEALGGSYPVRFENVARNMAYMSRAAVIMKRAGVTIGVEAGTREWDMVWEDAKEVYDNPL